MTPGVRRVHVRVTGRVQGVAYRASLQEHARKHGLLGWVRNCRDGSVEFLAQGTSHAIDALLAWAAEGPRFADVQALDVREQTAEQESSTLGGARDFEVRYSS